jgi:hypothetical protein
MIDKIFYKFFSYIDSWVEWVENCFQKPKKKNKKKKTTRFLDEGI